ncbi:DUF881 domain-containing protein [Nocardioides sp.]|uniref:DUF881 domain-containing protein n=1 Tax=Nocardioides sp. TaxID=35761 RepID=UPI00273446C5|nr:DUF881 domain-containing protein [Nocardioides sp.]MDP3894701.1 DUF881 domain-containing protein [Nocardioides sp.]
MADAGATGPRELPDHVTLPLLTLITRQSLDEEYRQVAEARQRSGAARVPGPRGPHRTAAVVIALFGMLVATAAIQTNRNAGADESGRASLVAQVNERRDNLAQLQGRAAELRARNAELDAEVRTAAETERTEQNRLRRLRVRTGHIAVTGPGVRARVDDAPGADAKQAVRDDDLAILVNGLWRAGAEAIAINGQRLSVLSAIRNVGPAVHVNSRPVNPPYVVLAVGNPDTLQADFANTSSGLTWLSLQRGLGFEFSMNNEESLTLPAARPPVLRAAREGSSSDQQQDRNPAEEEVAS